jgi:hypothetical protein
MLWIGWIAGPALWATSTQLGLVLPDHDCGSHVRFNGIAALLACVLAFVGALLSWRAGTAGRTGAFSARLAILLNLVFAFALLLQTGAGFMLSGCER